jgi:CheY-like chemotaxis protein
MVKVVAWLQHIENRAAEIYDQAATVFHESEPAFAAFLQHLSQEETEHGELLARLAGTHAEAAMADASIVIDDELRSRVEGPFEQANRLLARKEVSKEAMIEVIAESEFSEWNEIFLYAINTLKGLGREFQKAVAEIETHRQEIERFITSQPGSEHIFQRIPRLHPVWGRRLLVVEDDPAIANLIRALLYADTEVVIAANGEEGLELLRREHFDVVIADVQMPKLTGIELHRKACGIDPELCRHFIFFTSSRAPEHRAYAHAHGTLFLQKPAPLSSLRKSVDQVAGMGRPTH